jgi:importin-7
MQQEQPQFYASLTSHLSADEQTIITGACQQADNLLLHQQQTAAAEAQ